MKNLLAILLMVTLVMPTFAQEKSDVSAKKNAIKINALSFIWGAGSISYERKINEHSSAQIDFAYVNRKVNDIRLTGIGLTTEYRLYTRKKAIDGFYLAPNLSYQQANLEATNKSKASYTIYGGGANIGRQWILNSGFTLDLFLGAYYNKGNVYNTSGAYSFNTNSFEGFGIIAGFTLGFAF